MNSQLPLFVAPAVDLTSYDIILVNTSAGKDSQAMMDLIVDLATAAGVRNRLIAVHCDLGRMEWAGTKELAAAHARHYDMRFEIVRKDGGDLLDAVERRGMWPSANARYCTSDYKRGPVRKLMTALVSERRQYKDAPQIRILNCMGLRAEESPARAKRIPFRYDAAGSNKSRRHVDEWLPILHWTEAEVWARIRASGVPHHPAYDKGMKRLSCVFCIFAPFHQLVIAGRHNPELLSEYVGVETRIGHRFQDKLSIADVQNALTEEP